MPIATSIQLPVTTIQDPATSLQSDSPVNLESNLAINPNAEQPLEQIHQAAPTINNKSQPDISSEDLIKLFETTILPRWQEKYKLSDTSIGVLKTTIKNYLDDNNMIRIMSALGNEVAVAINESMKQWGFPKLLANTLYYGLWAVALGATAARGALRGLGTQSIKPFLETTVQDAIAAIFGPTGVVLLSNKIQDLFYKSVKVIPQSLINFARPLISVTLAEMSIPRILDPIGKTIGKFSTNMIPKRTYEKYSDLLSNKLQNLLKVKQ